MARAQRDSNLNKIQEVDPNQVAFLEEIKRRRRSFQTGTAFESQIRNIRSAQAGTQQNVLRAAGGSGGAALAGLSRTQLATGAAINDIGQEALRAQLLLAQEEEDLEPRHHAFGHG